MADIICICCGCGSIKNESGVWARDLDYRRLLPSNRLSHGICPACVERIYPELAGLLAERALAAKAEAQRVAPPRVSAPWTAAALAPARNP